MIWESCLCRHYAPRHRFDLDWLLSMNVAIYSSAILFWTLSIIMRQADPCFNHIVCCSIATSHRHSLLMSVLTKDRLRCCSIRLMMWNQSLNESVFADWYPFTSFKMTSMPENVAAGFRFHLNCECRMTIHSHLNTCVADVASPDENIDIEWFCKTPDDVQQSNAKLFKLWLYAITVHCMRLRLESWWRQINYGWGKVKVKATTLVKVREGKLIYFY